MKTILAISLLVGVALCSSTAFYGWAPRKEMTYRFETQILTGIPDIESQYSGLKLASDVRIQTFDDYSLRIKFENPRYVVVNQKLATRDGRPQVPKPEQELPEPLRRHMSSPFLVHLKRGVVEELFVEKDEPVVVTNIKKALLSQLQMDLSGSRRPEGARNNEVNKMQHEQSATGDQEITNYFSTFESTVLGDCETSYTINPLPNFQAKEIEERMKVSEKQLMQEGVIAGERSEGEEACRGKQYWEVVKTKSFDNCKNSPVYQSASGIKLKCDFSKAECSDALTHTSSTRYVLCGSSSRDFYIREAITDNNVLTNPLGWIASDEKMTTISRVTLNLMKVKSSGSSPMPKPTNMKKENSLVFQYPKQNLWSPRSATKALSPEEETNEYGLDSLMAKPDLRSESAFFPSPLPISELKQKIAQEMEKVVREIYKSPQSCSSKSDIAGSISTISHYLRPLSFDNLKEVERSLHQQSMTPEQREIAQELFLDVLAMTATNPAAMLVKEKIQRENLPERVIVKALQATIRNIKTPTQELFRELLQLVKSQESRRHIFNIALVQLSNLVNKACVNSDSQTDNFPVRIYGQFCKENSEFVTREYIPYLTQKLHETNKESHKLVIISALGKVGHKNVFLPLVQCIEERSLSAMSRSVSVYMLKRLAKNEPAMVKPVLLALINNPAENTEVRIAAVSVLPWSQPTTAELQKIALRSWFEPSKQVTSFIYSTLKSIVHTEIPELKNVGQRAKGLLESVKPGQYGIQFSRNANTQKFIDYLRAASNLETSYVNTENSFTPSRLSLTSRLFGNSWEIEGLSFGIYTKGMDSLIDSLWQKFGYKSEISEQVREQLQRIGEKLNIKNRKDESPASFIYFGMLGYDRVYSMDKEIYGEIMEKATEELRNNPEMFTNGRNFNYTHAKYAIDLEAVGPTDSGFSIVTSRNVPFVAGIKGHIQTEGKMGERFSMKTKIIPVINAKMQTNMGVISPFTKEFIGAGVEASIHLTMPMTFKSVMTKTGSFELSLQSPEDIQHQFEVVHAFIKPYTVRKSLEAVEPISKSQHVKNILAMSQTQKQVTPIGKSLGLKGLLTVETDYPTPYFSNVWNMIQKHNLVSLASLSFPASVRFSSFKLEYNPSESSTKEIEAVVRTVYGVNDEVSGPVVHYPTQDEINENNEMEVNQICQERHPNSHKQKELCKEQLKQRTANRKNVHSKVMQLLEQNQSGSSVSGLAFDAAIKSESSHRTLNTAVLINGQGEENQIQGRADIMFNTPSGPQFEVEIEGKMELPNNKYRWNVESMVEQPIVWRNNFVAKYGRKGENKQEIVLESTFVKTEGHKMSLKESAEMRKCRTELEAGRTLSPICEEVRHQASSVNKVELKASIPRELQQSWFVEKAIYGIANELLPLISVKKNNNNDNRQQNTEGRTQLKVTAEVNRRGDTAQTWIEGSDYNVELRNITVPQAIQGFFPLSLRNGISTRLMQDMSRNQVPASCRLDRFVSTFDNKTYDYELNECEHLLFKDCSNHGQKTPLAVLAKKMSDNSGKKEVKILSSKNIIQLRSEQSGQSSDNGVTIKVDGQRISVAPGKTFIKRSSQTGKVVLRIYRTHDGVVAVRNPVEGLEVFFDGKRVEVAAPQNLRNRACGLCGDLNGENTADLKTPEQCIMSSPRLAAFSYILEDGQCPGIPSKYRDQYKKEKSQCIKKHNIHTPLKKLAKASLMNKLKQESLAHVVKIQKNQVCISKSPVRSCPENSRPEHVKSVEVSFVCMVRTYGKTQQILKRIEAGELINEALKMPTSFTKKQLVPTKCERSQRSYSDRDAQQQQQQWQKQQHQQQQWQGQDHQQQQWQGQEHQQQQWQGQDQQQQQWQGQDQQQQQWQDQEQEKEQREQEQREQEQREQQQPREQQQRGQQQREQQQREQEQGFGQQGQRTSFGKYAQRSQKTNTQNQGQRFSDREQQRQRQEQGQEYEFDSQGF